MRLVLGLVGLMLATDSWAQELGRTVIVRDAVANDLYVAGRHVEVLAPVAGDLVAAGSSVIVIGDVSEDVIAAGRSVTISGAVGDDVRLAGRSVTLAGNVGGHAVVLGRAVQLEENSRIADFAWIRGTWVEISGQVLGDLKVRGTVIVLNGQVDGDADLTARDIRIGDGAVIKGNLTWRARGRPQISDTAVIEGELIQGQSRRRLGRGGWFRRLFIVLSVIVAAGLLYTVFRPWCDQCAATLQSRPWATPLTGLAVLATTPVAMGLLFVTGVGALLAVVLLLAYALALLLGALAGVVAIAKLGLSRFTQDSGARLWLAWSAIAIVAIVMGALYIVRPVGILVATLVMLIGLGALGLDAYRSFRVSRA
jgi:cytoskeletal protein CcmA (bactofilin family)